MNWLEPWYPTNDELLLKELENELVYGHVLYGVPIQIIGRRQDCDDVLFKLTDGTDRVAVVHLAFNRETSPDWPRTRLFESVEDFSIRCMRVDHEAFNA